MKNYHAIRRNRLVQQLGGICVKCGEIDNLEFDHIDPTTKSFTIGRTWYSEDLVQEELKKCQLLCRECHKSKTYKVREHGTDTMFKHGKCRCQLCKDAHNQYMRIYKKKWRLKKKSGIA